jgi:hypothetical protein
MDVAFQMVDGNERFAEPERKCLGVGDPDEQRARQTRTFGDGDGIEIVKGELRLGQRGAYHRYDIAEVLTGGQFRHHATVGCVRGNLGGNNIGKLMTSALDHRRSGFVAGAFDAENQATRQKTHHIFHSRGAQPAG